MIRKEVTPSEIPWKSKKATMSANRANLYNPFFSSTWLSLSSETNVHIPSAGSVRLHVNREGAGTFRHQPFGQQKCLPISATTMSPKCLVKYVHIPLVP